MPRRLESPLTVALLTAAMATSAQKSSEHTNSVGMSFVRIPDGSFRMDSTDSDREADADADEKPATA